MAQPTPPAAQPLSIRPARSADLATIVAFNAALANETENRELDSGRLTRGVAALLDDPAKGRYFLAQRAQRVVGQIMLTDEWSDWRAGAFWWIQSVYVRPDERKNGVFSRLFEHIRDLARSDSSVCGLRLYVDHDNHRAQDVYRHLGGLTTDYALMEWDFTQ